MRGGEWRYPRSQREQVKNCTSYAGLLHPVRPLPKGKKTVSVLFTHTQVKHDGQAAQCAGGFLRRHAPLPRLIGDKTVRTKDIREFLEKDYPPESLSSVDEAKALIAEHRKSIEAHLKFEQRAEVIEALKRNQAQRRAQREKELSDLKHSASTASGSSLPPLSGRTGIPSGPVILRRPGG